MIIDTIENLHLYRAVNNRLEDIIAFLKDDQNYRTLENGKHEIASNVFVLVMEYDTKKEADTVWEAHRRYIDVQVLLAGTERIGYSNLKRMTATNEYVARDDYQLFSGGAQNYFVLVPGTFVFLAPEDVHKTSIALDEATQSKVKKLVFKVPVLA